MPPSNIDLNEIARNNHLAISIASVHEENSKDAFLRRIKEMILFVTVLFFVIAAFIFCGYVLLNQHSTSDDKKWSMTIASSILSAAIGFLTGKKIR